MPVFRADPLVLDNSWCALPRGRRFLPLSALLSCYLSLYFACMYSCTPGAHMDQKREPDAPEVGIQVVVSHHLDAGN